MKRRPANHIFFDIGSNKIAAICASISKTGDSVITAQALRHSAGFRAGRVVDLEAAEIAIMEVIYSLEKESNKSIKEIMVSLSGAVVKSYFINHSLKIGNQAISAHDAKKLIQKTLENFSVKDQEIIHYFPIEFTLDGNHSVENPIGMYAKELGCHLHILAASSLALKNLVNCFAKCHIQVEGFILSTYAVGLSCLSDDERETGAVIIDFGSFMTGFGVFWNGKILYSGSVPLGGYHITADIARNLSVSISTAEKLKILYGDVRPELFNKQDTIRINGFEGTHEHNEDFMISSSKLAEIIRPRIEEILTLLKKEYDHLSIDHLLAKRIVQTGGGAQLSGLKNLVAEIFQKQVRMARPEILEGFSANYNPLDSSTAIGMVKSKALKYKKNSFKSGDQEDQGWVKRMFLWFRENI